MTGALSGLRVVELAGMGPCPHAAMVFADLDADVVRLERPAAERIQYERDQMLRNRRVVTADLKDPCVRERVLGLVDSADVLLEGYRPGVTERLGLGPDVCLSRNPGLVYARLTGWGREGPLAARAGHDINCLSLTGALHAIGRDTPVPPLNLVADFGGGSMLALVGVLAALWEREKSGVGQVVDAAMVDGVSLLMQSIWGLYGSERWSVERESNLLDGGCPFYGVYRCADDRFVAVGALEPQFYAELVEGLGLGEEDLPEQYDEAGWPTTRKRFGEVLSTRGRDDWVAHFAGTDACVTPVLSLAEAPAHPHIAARGTLRDVGGVTQAAPAPRFSRTAAPDPAPPPVTVLDLDEIREQWAS